MDEGVRRRRLTRRPGQQSMLVEQAVRKRRQRAPHAVGRVSIVMQVHLDFTEPGMTETGECIEVFGPVLLRWIEESVLGCSAVRVAKA